MPLEDLNILMLASDNPTSWIIYNQLVREFGLFPMLVENSVSRRQLFRNRINKLGWGKAASQVMFVSLIRPLLNWRSHKRITEICRSAGLEPTPPITSAVMHIDSVNDDECRTFIRETAPNLIIVNGTRIIGKKTLAAAGCTFINTHHGITPKYRGAHGAYWALLNNDKADCGVTVHLVDEGIDTGKIIGQARIAPGTSDNFVTYPYLLTAAALPILTRAIASVKAGTLTATAGSGTSAIWYHPGFFQYIRGWFRGVR